MIGGLFINHSGTVPAFLLIVVSTGIVTIRRCLQYKNAGQSSCPLNKAYFSNGQIHILKWFFQFWKAFAALTVSSSVYH